MHVRFVAVDLRALDELKSEAIALPFFEDVRPPRGALGLVDWRLCGQVSRLLVRGYAAGSLGESVLVPTRPRLPFDKLVLFGAGPISELDEERFGVVVRNMLHTLDRARIRASVLALPGRADEIISATVAMELFLEQAAQRAEHDQVTLIESPDAQRSMIPVVEREKRRARAQTE